MCYHSLVTEIWKIENTVFFQSIATATRHKLSFINYLELNYELGINHLGSQD